MKKMNLKNKKKIIRENYLKKRELKINKLKSNEKKK